MSFRFSSFSLLLFSSWVLSILCFFCWVLVSPHPFSRSVSVLRSRDEISCKWRSVVTPQFRCARCLPVIRPCCHVICLCVAFYHVIMCISFCIHVCFMHPSFFPVVRFAIRHSYALRRSPFVSHCERVLDFLVMDWVLPSDLGIAPVDRLSSFVPFGGRLILQRLTR